MAIKVYSGAAFADIANVKVFNGTAFEAPKEVKAFNGTSWEKVWPDSATGEAVTATWSVKSIWTYLNSGSIQTAHKNEPIQGSYDGTASNTRRSLLLFDYSAIKTALAGASIEKVELYLKRLNTSHGTATAYACVKMHNYSGKQATWKGADLGDADSGSPTFTRGQGKWITLLNTVGEKLRDGTIKGLCLDADTNYTLSRYIKYDDDIRLRITYRR